MTRINLICEVLGNNVEKLSKLVILLTRISFKAENAKGAKLGKVGKDYPVWNPSSILATVIGYSLSSHPCLPLVRLKCSDIWCPNTDDSGIIQLPHNCDKSEIFTNTSRLWPISLLGVPKQIGI